MRLRFLGALTVLMMLLYASMAGAEDSRTRAMAEEAEQFITDRVHLFANCSDVGIDVYLSADAGEELRTSLETAARSRLRGARIYKAPPGPVEGILKVDVTVAGDVAFTYHVWFEKMQTDTMADLGFADWSPTGWTRSAVGTSTDTNFILGSLSQVFDEFIDEYLRVNNDAACVQSRLTPVDHDPFASGVRLGPPLDHDPFAEEKEESP